MNQSQLNKLLFVAISQHNIDDFLEVLNEGADVNSNEKWVFQRVCDKNSHKIISPLELAIFSYLSYDDLKKTPIAFKCTFIIRELIRRGAKINTFSGIYPFGRINVSILKSICYNFAQIKVDSNRLEDCYHVQRHCDVILILLKHGANPMFDVKELDYDCTSWTRWNSALDPIVNTLEKIEFVPENLDFCNKIIEQFLLCGAVAPNHDQVDDQVGGTVWPQKFLEWPLVMLFFCLKRRKSEHIIVSFSLMDLC